MPAASREWTSVRKVCDSTVGRPRWTRRPRFIAPAAIDRAVSTGTIGLMQISRSAPASSATEAWSVLSSTPSR